MEKNQNYRKICSKALMIKLALAGSATRQGLNHVISPNPAENKCQIESKTKAKLENLCLVEAGRKIHASFRTTISSSTFT